MEKTNETAWQPEAEAINEDGPRWTLTGRACGHLCGHFQAGRPVVPEWVLIKADVFLAAATFAE